VDIVFRFSSQDIGKVKQLIKDHRKDRFVVDRIRRNVGLGRPSITPSRCWHVHMMCLLTTRQRSGPKSPVYQFLASEPFALDLATVRREKRNAKYVATVLKKFGGIQRYNDIGTEVSDNLQWFDGGEWKALKARLNSLSTRRGYKPERDTAMWLSDNFTGFGPKQSRNFLQALGLTRYEIPIDSRVTDWLRNDFKFPLAVGSKALNDPDYYGFVNDAIREMCKEVGTYPCVLDAVLFSRVDKGSWEGVKPIF